MSRHTHTGGDLGAVVERRMRNWELSRQQMRRRAAAGEGPSVLPYVAVSRDVGASAEEIARRAAERLGWEYYDKELLDYVAQEESASRRLIESLDESTISWIEDALKGVWARSSLELQYFRAVHRTIIALCRHCHAVIVGRGSTMILPADAGLRVRMVAPRWFRIRSVAREEGVAESRAEELLDAREEERAVYLVKHFGRYPYDARRYDLTLNTSQFSVDGACEVILGALEAKTGVKAEAGAVAQPATSLRQV